MHDLRTYVTTIVNEDRDLFDVTLDRISHESNVRPNNRLGSIIPLDRITIYEVELTTNEVVVMKLSCPGEYIFVATWGDRDEMVALLQEREWLNDPSK